MRIRFFDLILYHRIILRPLWEVIPLQVCFILHRSVLIFKVFTVYIFASDTLQTIGACQFDMSPSLFPLGGE